MASSPVRQYARPRLRHTRAFQCKIWVEFTSAAIFVFAVLATLAAWFPIGRYGRLGLAGVVTLAGFGFGMIGGEGLAALLVLLLVPRETLNHSAFP
jgi:hypothetical protein